MNSTAKIISFGGIAAMLAVISGAFGAHALKTVIDDHALASWETACRYQMYHSMAIILCGLLDAIHPSKHFVISAKLFLSGIFCFCGSLYLIALKDVMVIPLSIIGPITPIGGVLFITGWFYIVRGAAKFEKSV